MCGILGVIGPRHREIALHLRPFLERRGRDGFGMESADDCTLAHALHAVVGHCVQPLMGKKGMLVANCEIYNYKEINTRLGVHTDNDAQTLLLAIETWGVEKTLKELDGDFAFIYQEGSTLYFARDPIGVKPLFIGTAGEEVIICSEERMITELGAQATHVEPGVLFVKTQQGITHQPYNTFAISEQQMSEKEAIAGIRKSFSSSVHKRADIKRAAVLFSGGLDSSYIATELSKTSCKIHLYSASYQDGNLIESKDAAAAKIVAQELGVPYTHIKVGNKEVEEALHAVLEMMDTNDPIKVGVGLTIYFATKAAVADGHKVVFSGLGAEESFAGYRRHLEAADKNTECLAGLRDVHKGDLYRDDVLTMHLGAELRVPFFDRELINFALTIPSEMKIVDGVRKYILRQAALAAGVPPTGAMRPKLAAQYGSNFQKALERLSRTEGSIRAYFAQVSGTRTTRLDHEHTKRISKH